MRALQSPLRAAMAAPELVRPGHRWSRGEVGAWLAQRAEDGADMLVGFDFSAAFAHRDAGAYFPGWADSPAGMTHYGRRLRQSASERRTSRRQRFLTHPEGTPPFPPRGGRCRRPLWHRHRAIARRRGAPARDRPSRELEQLQSRRSRSGRQSLARGDALLHRLHPALPFWPLDPVPTNGPLLIEIYTSVAARAAGMRAGLSKIRDGERAWIKRSRASVPNRRG